MNIPEGVIEDAAKASFRSAFRGCSWDGVNPTTEETRARYRRDARAALEAAAPALMAQAWEEGLEYKGENVWPEEYAANPYGAAQ